VAPSYVTFKFLSGRASATVVTVNKIDSVKTITRFQTDSGSVGEGRVRIWAKMNCGFVNLILVSSLFLPTTDHGISITFSPKLYFAFRVPLD
jgi:hypothetical protein